MAGNIFQQPNIEIAQKNLNFTEGSIRAAFIRKVFFLVSIMLTIVAVMTAIPYMNNDFKVYLQTHRWLFWVSFGIFIGLYLILACVSSVRRSFPLNLICLTIFTLAAGFFLMIICTHYSVDTVLLALVMCAISCGGIILFSSQTKYDITSHIGIISIAGMVVFAFGLVALVATIAFKVRILYTIYAGVACLLMMAYLAVDIQMIMGGKQYEVSPEDYIFSALQIFMDIINIFMMLLSLLNGTKN